MLSISFVYLKHVANLKGKNLMEDGTDGEG